MHSSIASVFGAALAFSHPSIAVDIVGDRFDPNTSRCKHFIRMQVDPWSRARTRRSEGMHTSKKQAVVLIDPVSSGRFLKEYVLQAGFDLIGVFTLSDVQLADAGK